MTLLAVQIEPQPPREPTHADGYAVFTDCIKLLYSLGWKPHRVDTLKHPNEVWTVRHHFTHGEWELYFEPDRYWNPHSTEGKLVKIRLDRPPLPTATRVVGELLGLSDAEIITQVRAVVKDRAENGQ